MGINRLSTSRSDSSLCLPKAGGVSGLPKAGGVLILFLI